MTELDLGLKVAARRVLWRMGYSTRIDVELRSIPAASGPSGRRRADGFTDLDVLGIGWAPGFRSQRVIVDCKSSSRSPTERMFWVRGVGDFFSADATFMLRSGDLPAPARQLAARLAITAWTSEELSLLEQFHPSSLPFDAEPLSWLFDRERVAASNSAFGDLDRRLKSLNAYRQFSYWVHEPHRAPVQLVEHLREASSYLDPRNPIHVSLLLDVSWLYLISVARAAEHIRAVQVSQPLAALTEYLLGGPAGVREKSDLAALLDGLKQSGAIPETVDTALVPEYFPSLLELTVRVLRRPDTVITALQYLELSVAATLGKFEGSLKKSLGTCFDELAAKQASDIVGFLVRSAKLDNQFRLGARGLLLDESADGATGA